MIGHRDRDLERRLSELRAPGEDEAEERAWPVVSEAYRERRPVARSPRGVRVAVAIAGGLALIAIGLSPAGAKVGDLVSEVTGIGEEDAKPELRSLPAAGELLVETDRGLWLVRDDGSKRLMGEFADGAWSPNGLYVAASRERELVALEPDGTVRWTLPAAGAVHDPRWAGSELDTRIAYRSGTELRVIAGDGDPASDRLIARHVAPVPPAWQPVEISKLEPGTPERRYVLSYVDAGGRVRTVDAENGEDLRPTRADRRSIGLDPAGAPPGDRAPSPDTSRVARIEHVGATDRVVIERQGGGRSVLFSARGRLTGPTWSPDGRWLLVGWPAADQWLFIEVGRPHHVVAFENIRKQFESAGDAPSFPRPAGWILPLR